MAGAQRFNATLGVWEDVVGQPGATGSQGAKGNTGSTGPTGPAASISTQYKGAWTTSTSYAVNDLFTFQTSLYVVNTAHTSAGSTPDGVKTTLFMPGQLADEPVNTQSAITGTYTIPAVSVASIHRLTLTGNVTFTFPTAAAGREFTLWLVQDATGGRVVTWPSVKWPSAVAPVLSTGVNKIDIVTFFCSDGANWEGLPVGYDMR